MDNVVSKEMAEKGEKVISFAFKEIKMHELSELSKMRGVETNEFRRYLEEHLIYLCTFGMEDPLRNDIKQSILSIRYGNPDGPARGQEDDDDKKDKPGCNVRMVTGDHLETAKKVAYLTGIVRDQDKGHDGVAMTGDEFRQ